VSGGSSAGSAVVVAQGDVPVALATDTAGSGRVPAALNGIAALKPTRGRLSTAGVVPACRSLDCLAVFAATPRDAAFVAEVADGGPDDPDPDPWSRPVPPGVDPRWWRPLGRAPRVGVPGAGRAWFAADPVAEAAHAAALASLTARGWELVEVDLAPFRTGGDLLYGGAYVAERYAAVGETVRAGGPGLDPVVAGIIGAAAEVRAWRAFADADRLAGLRAATRATWDRIDALALPVVPTTVRIDAVAADPLGTNQMLGTYTTFANLFDLCAAVVPVGGREDGHPWGLQLLAPAFHDGIVAALAEEAAGPAVAVPDGMVPLVVAGAHLRGEARAHEIEDRGGVWLTTTRTAPCYDLRLLTGEPARPGLVHRAGGGGAAIEVDVWALPPSGWAQFVATGVPGLAVGRIELADGGVLPGFVAAGPADGPDLTPWGGWRAWRRAGAPR
jgi:allophanate hydrolase